VPLPPLSDRRRIRSCLRPDTGSPAVRRRALSSTTVNAPSPPSPSPSGPFIPTANHAPVRFPAAAPDSWRVYEQECTGTRKPSALKSESHRKQKRKTDILTENISGFRSTCNDFLFSVRSTPEDFAPIEETKHVQRLHVSFRCPFFLLKVRWIVENVFSSVVFSNDPVVHICSLYETTIIPACTPETFFVNEPNLW
jgi:hypothetical protein